MFKRHLRGHGNRGKESGLLALILEALLEDRHIAYLHAECAFFCDSFTLGPASNSAYSPKGGMETQGERELQTSMQKPYA
jgi:hypothetical protein